MALVTGAAQGIGQAIAVKLASRGAKTLLVDLNEPGDTARLIGRTAVAIAADVSSDSEWQRISSIAKTHFGRVDIVVNNAGIYPFATIDDLTYDIWRKTLAVNLDSNFYSAKHFVPGMRRQRWGRFINVSSSSIGTSQAGLSHYMASKMGIIGFVRGLANDVGNDGITVNAILPSLTNTPGTKGVPDDAKKQVWLLQAIRRMAQPGDIAGPVAFLASDEAAFITGQALVVDGGLYKIS